MIKLHLFTHLALATFVLIGILIAIHDKIKSLTWVYFDKPNTYNQKAKVVFSKERYAKTEEGLNKSAFNPSTPIDCSEKRVMKVMNQEGEYQTTFQGFVRSNGMVYALVGGPGKTDPVSSVSIQHEYGDISKLLADEVGHIGRKLKVQHDVARSADGLQFQVLIALEIID